MLCYAQFQITDAIVRVNGTAFCAQDFALLQPESKNFTRLMMLQYLGMMFIRVWSARGLAIQKACYSEILKRE